MGGDWRVFRVTTCCQRWSYWILYLCATSVFNQRIIRLSFDFMLRSCVVDHPAKNHSSNAGCRRVGPISWFISCMWRRQRDSSKVMWVGCSCGWDLIHCKNKYLPFFLGLGYLWFIDSHYISSTLNNKSSRIVKHQRTRSSYNSWFLSNIQMSYNNFYYMI